MTLEEAIQKLIDIARAQEGNNQLTMHDQNGHRITNIKVVNYMVGSRAVVIEANQTENYIGDN